MAWWTEHLHRSLILMLKALKTAAEAYLETPLSAAEVAFPFPVTEAYRDALRAAMSFLSLEMPMSNQPPAGILATRVHGIGNPCESLTYQRQPWSIARGWRITCPTYPHC